MRRCLDNKRKVHLSLWLRVTAVVCLTGNLLVSHPTAQAQQNSHRGVEPVENTGSDGRVALVFGNADYTSIAPLKNSANDAEDVSRILGELGFEVIKRIDQSREEMYQAIRSFAESAKGAEVALLFYAGHGVELGGENYLIPVDVGRFDRDDFQVDSEAVSLGQALAAMKHAATQVVVLDACRNSPFPDEIIGSNSSGGWAIPPAKSLSGTLVAYGTAPGSVASDNIDGRNGLFTKALLEEMVEPGIEAAEMMRRVTRRVREASSDTQSPWLSASYVLPFYFIEPRSGSRPTISTPVSEIEQWATNGLAAYTSEDYRAALPLLKKAAQAGHTESQYHLGKMYLAGRGVESDADRAADWFELASMRGHPQAQYFLGGMYSGGFGSRTRDDVRAADLYQRAAEQGLSAGQFRLGLVYETGRGRAKDVDEALRWYLQAARQGHDKAVSALERLARERNDQAKAMLRLLDFADAGE